MSEKQVRKTQARVKQREQARAHEQRRNNLKIIVPLIAAAFVVVVVAASAMYARPDRSAVQVNGTPRLQIDRDQIDLGRRIFNQPIRAVFNIQNTGDGTLKLEVPRVANVLEGC